MKYSLLVFALGVLAAIGVATLIRPSKTTEPVLNQPVVKNHIDGATPAIDQPKQIARTSVPAIGVAAAQPIAPPVAATRHRRRAELHREVKERRTTRQTVALAVPAQRSADYRPQPVGRTDVPTVLREPVTEQQPAESPRPRLRLPEPEPLVREVPEASPDEPADEIASAGQDRMREAPVLEPMASRDPVPTVESRSRRASGAIIAGSTIAGAILGGITGGGRGAVIGAASGGAGGFIFDRLTRRRR